MNKKNSLDVFHQAIIGTVGTGKTITIKHYLVKFIIDKNLKDISLGMLLDKLKNEPLPLGDTLIFELENNKEEYLKLLNEFNIR